MLHEIGDAVAIVLLKYLFDSLSNLDKLKIIGNDKLEVNVKIEDVGDFLKCDLIANTKHGINFFKHKKGYSSIGKKKLYAGLISYFIHFLENGGKDELPPALFAMVNIWGLSKKNDRLHEFYIYFSSLLHKMHFFGDNQKARDFSELAIMLALKDKTLHYSFYVRMANFARQRNVIDSLLSANAMLYGINKNSYEYDIFLSKFFLELFILLRNFQLYPYAENIKEARDKLDINDEYDFHQFDMAYFNMLLSRKSPEVFEKVDIYLKNNDITKFGKFSGIPWFVLLYNLQRLNSEAFSNYGSLSNCYDLLSSDQEITNATIIKDLLSGMSDDVSENKKIVINAVKNIQKSRDHHDVNYEVMAVRPLVYTLLKNSIKTNNVEGILIAHSLTSDTSYIPICTDRYGLDTYPISVVEVSELESIYDDYMSYIEPLITESDDKQFIWIGCNDDFSYSLSLSKGNFNIIKYDEFKRDDLLDWSRNEIEKYAFNDQPNINEILQSKEYYWRDETELLLQKVPALVGEIYSETLVVFRDTTISAMPINIIKNSDNVSLCDICSIITPLTVTKYINSTAVHINTDVIKLWAPIENSDWAIQIAYGKIADEFTDQEMIKIDTLDPQCELNKDINIFISHGGNDDLYGFKSISTGSGLYVIDECAIFGSGKIAILFICHSGNSKASWYANKINSLIDKVLSLGYETVIAPAWSYNVTLAGLWTSTFIAALRDGNNVIKSNYMANIKVKQKFVGIGAYAAMHVFGNNNIC
ncbi:TPA: hypothetical protein ACPZAA_000124 [Yersinia enterocolitica]